MNYPGFTPGTIVKLINAEEYDLEVLNNGDLFEVTCEYSQRGAGRGEYSDWFDCINLQTGEKNYYHKEDFEIHTYPKLPKEVRSQLAREFAGALGIKL